MNAPRPLARRGNSAGFLGFLNPGLRYRRRYRSLALLRPAAPRPLAHFACPGRAPHGHPLSHHARKNVTRELRKGEAVRDFDVLRVSEFVDYNPYPVVAPDLGDAQVRVDRKSIEGWTGDVDFDDQVRRWIHLGVYLHFATNAFFVLNVEASVGFEATLQLFTPECRRAQVYQIELHLFRHEFDQQRDQAVWRLVATGDDHYLQYPLIVSEARRTPVPMIGEQVLVSLPTYVMENCSLLGRNLYRFHRVPFSTLTP